MRALFALQEWYAQTGLFDGELLQLIEEDRLAARIALRGVIGQGEEAAARPDIVGLGTHGEAAAAFLLRHRVSAELVYVHAGHVHLPHLFLQGHA